MNALRFAWRSLVRQPARAALGILGVAAVGALLFDMLLLSDGLVVSMRDLLARAGFDVRVTVTGELPRGSTRIEHVSDVAAVLAELPTVRSALAIRFAEGSLEMGEGAPLYTTFQGVNGQAPMPWTVIRGDDIHGPDHVVINQALAERLHLDPGAELMMRAGCRPGSEVLPRVRFRVSGIVDFPFEGTNENTVAGSMQALDRACGGNSQDEAELILVMSAGDPDKTATAIERLRPDLRAVTNEQMLGRFRQTGFTYFQQISTVLTTVTLSFALLLITVLLTVSVNQRLGEIAALRALGFSRMRVVADVLSESALIVGAGGLLSLPIGVLLANGLDRILKSMPGIPADMHFFVFEANTLVLHVTLLAVTAIIAAAYPMQIVARLPIAATLRAEVTS
jgi:putative ABC transport system permease protein